MIPITAPPASYSMQEALALVISNLDINSVIILTSIAIILIVTTVIAIFFMAKSISIFFKKLVKNKNIKGLKLFGQELLLEEPPEEIGSIKRGLDKEIQENISVRMQDVLSFIEIFTDRIEKITDKKNKKLEILMRSYELLEEQMENKCSNKLIDFLSDKLSIPKDMANENELYYYIMSIFNNIMTKIKLEWKDSFMKNGFEEISEEEEYVNEKTFTLKSIMNLYIHSNFRSSKISKIDLINLLGTMELSFKEMNIILFNKAKKETENALEYINNAESEIKSIKNRILNYRYTDKEIKGWI